MNDVLVVGVTLQSRLTKWEDDETSTFHKFVPVLSTCKAFSDELDVNPESYRIFQPSQNKHKKLTKFKLRPHCLCYAKRHGDDVDCCQMRGEHFRLAWLNERVKKWNAEHGDKPRKSITLLPPLPMESTATNSESQDENALL